MNLPTQAQVNAATRHAASFAAGAIAMFSLSTKIDPATAVAIINSLGSLTNDVIMLVGLVTPLIAGWFASRSASPAAQIAAVASNPDVKQVVVTTPALANASPSEKVVAK